MKDPIARSMVLSKLRERAFKTGTFMLASGKISKYYLDCKKALLHNETLLALSQLLLTELRLVLSSGVQAIGGPEVGAIPIVSAFSIYLYGTTAFASEGYVVETFFVRKQAKDHGSQSLIEGRVELGDRVVIIEDVVTTGDSVLRAIQEVEKLGAVVVKVVCVVDRLEGGADKLKAYDFQSIFTIRDFGMEPPAVAASTETPHVQVRDHGDL